jgi:hypothetical protein
MTFEDAQQKLIDHRNAALVKHGNSLLARGMNVDDQAFRTSMLNYGWDLEVWRMSALEEIASAIGSMTSRSAARH